QVLIKRRLAVENEVNRLRGMADGLGDYEGGPAPRPDPAETLPLLRELSKGRPALEARVQTLEARVKSLETAGRGEELEAVIARQDLGLSRAELNLVSRFDALAGPPGAAPPAALSDV